LAAGKGANPALIAGKWKKPAEFAYCVVQLLRSMVLWAILFG